jgi:hypothetical protein
MSLMWDNMTHCQLSSHRDRHGPLARRFREAARETIQLQALLRCALPGESLAGVLLSQPSREFFYRATRSLQLGCEPV